MTGAAWSKPAVAMGDFVVLAGETFAAMFRRPVRLAGTDRADLVRGQGVDRAHGGACRFHTPCSSCIKINILLTEVGAVDLSGAGASIAISSVN